MSIENNINIDISEENGKIVCSVSLTPLGRLCRTKFRLKATQVKQYVAAAGYPNAVLLQGPKVIHNYVPNEDPAGVWIFKIERPPKRAPKKRTKKSNTTEK